MTLWNEGNKKFQPVAVLLAFFGGVIILGLIFSPRGPAPAGSGAAVQRGGDGAAVSVFGAAKPTLAFDGEATRFQADADLPLPAMDGRHPVTFAFWIKRLASRADAVFVRGSDPFLCLCHFDGQDFSQMRFYFKRGSDTDSIRVYADAFNEINVWQHVAIAYDGSGRAAGVSIYKNGVPQKVYVLNDGLSGPVMTKEPFTVGAYRGFGQLGWFFKGLLEDFVVFDRELKSADIGELILTRKKPVSL